MDARFCLVGDLSDNPRSVLSSRKSDKLKCMLIVHKHVHRKQSEEPRTSQVRFSYLLARALTSPASSNRLCTHRQHPCSCYDYSEETADYRSCQAQGAARSVEMRYYSSP